MSYNPNRHQAGSPIGGRFAPRAKAAADGSVELTDSTGDTPHVEMRVAYERHLEAANKVAADLANKGNKFLQHIVASNIASDVPNAGLVVFSDYGDRGEPEFAITEAKYYDGTPMSEKDRDLVYEAARNELPDMAGYLLAVGNERDYVLDVPEATHRQPWTPLRLDDRVDVPVGFIAELNPGHFEELPEWPANLGEPDVYFEFDNGELNTTINFGDRTRAMKFWASSSESYDNLYEPQFDDLDEDDKVAAAEYGHAVHERIDSMTYAATLEATTHPELTTKILEIATGKHDAA